ncbi:MAG: DUF1559 domain-containing protein [Pirellulaceae bacterium]
MKAKQIQSGFTLVELLVVIAIIGILVGMLLPAVQQVREAARRTECSNNIRQIGLALHMHHESLRRLPVGWEVDDELAAFPAGTVPESGLPGWAWATKILPYLEQGNLYKEFDFSLAADDEAFEATREYVISTFLCPSDPSPDVMLWDWLAEEFEHDHDSGGEPFILHDPPEPHTDLMVSRCNYSGVFGSIEIEGNERNGNGLFFENSDVRFRDITDGLSNTLMCGERLATRGTVTWVGADPHIEEGAARIVGVTDHLPNDTEHAHFEDFASAHTVGAMFLSADGSVRLLPNFIDEEIFRGLASRSGQEIIGLWE